MKNLLRLLVATSLVAALSLPAFPQQSVPKSNFQPKAQDRDRDDRNERHPHIRSAIRELQEAKKELQTAAHDFGGHRAEALEAVDNAIRQLQQALQYDKK